MVMHNASSPRGNTLIIVMISLAVLSIIGLAAVQFSGRDVSSASNFQQRTSVERCAQAARNWALAQFRLGKEPPAPGMMLEVSLNGPTGGDTVRLISGGHYGDTATPVAQPGSDKGGVVKTVEKRTNVLFTRSGNGGGIYTAVCKDHIGMQPDGGGGRTYEVEFAFQANLNQ